MSADPARLTWVVVSYGGVEDAARLVASLGTETPVDVVLCANKPGDTEAATAALGSDPRVRILTFEDNPGYLPALHRALPHVDTDRPVVLSNCDLVAEPGCVEQLADQVAGLLAVLRAALDEGDPAAAHPAAEPPAEAAPSGRRVQHIRIERTGR